MEMINGSDHLGEISACVQFWDSTAKLREVKEITQIGILKNESKTVGEVKYVQELSKVGMIDLAEEIDFAGETCEILLGENS
jgi:hypothetical protein